MPLCHCEDFGACLITLALYPLYPMTSRFHLCVWLVLLVGSADFVGFGGFGGGGVGLLGVAGVAKMIK